MEDITNSKAEGKTGGIKADRGFFFLPGERN